jgi:hypothetical protein
MGLVLIGVVVATGLIVLRFSQASTPPELVQIYGARDLGKLQQSDQKVIGRDAGLSGMVGNRPFWAFGDTLYNTVGLNAKRYQFRSFTGGYGDLLDPLKVTDSPRASDGQLEQTVPFSEAELAYNMSTNQFDDRFAIWPAGVIPIDSENSYVFYGVFLIKPGNLNYTKKSTGVAKIQPGQYVATRIADNLFGNKQVGYQFREGDEIYVSSCRVDWVLAPCKVGKVQYLSVTDPTAYQWWDGKNWQGNYTAGKDIVDGSTTGLSIKHNPFLKKYTMVYSTFYDPNTVKLRLADKPEGPWSESQDIFKLPQPAAGKENNYAVSTHPEYDPTGKQLYVSYLNGNDSNIHLVQIHLAPVGAISIPLPEAASGTQVSQNNTSGTCNVQSGFKGDDNYRGCIVTNQSPLSITNAGFTSLASSSAITICAVALNSDQSPVKAELSNGGQPVRTINLEFGKDGLGKILACGKTTGPILFNTIKLTAGSSKPIYVSKLTVAPE